MLFDTNWIKNPTMVYNCLYYYEIPMNDGEYALGSVPERFGAYLIYLDISANKQEIQRQEVIETSEISSVTYEYPKGVQITDGSVYTSDLNSGAVRITQNNITLGLSRAGDVITMTGSGTPNYQGEYVTFKDSGGNTLTPVYIAQQVVRTYTRTHFDYNTTTKRMTIVKDVVTDTSTNGGAAVRQHRVFVNDVEDPEAEKDTSWIPASPTWITSYHYLKPAGATVTNTFVPIPQQPETGYNFTVKDYPAMAKPPVDKSSTITGYTITVVSTAATEVKMDTITWGAGTTKLNGSTFTAGGTVSSQ